MKTKHGLTAALTCLVMGLSACGGSPTGGAGTPASGANPGSPVGGGATVFTVSTLAGSGTQGYADGAGALAMFAYPSAVSVDGQGNVYVSDTTNKVLRKITPAGTVSTLAGQVGQEGYADGPGAAALFGQIVGSVVDPQGNLYVTDALTNRIRKISPTGEVSTFAGSGGFGMQDGDASQASFGGPQGITRDAAGNFYVADTELDVIRKITPDGRVTTIAGDGTEGYRDCNAGSCARFYLPHSLALDSKGNLYVTDQGNQRIRKITPDGAVFTLAGSGVKGYADGDWNVAMFDSPMGIVVDSKDNVYVSDQNNRVIRKITPAGVVSTVAGQADYMGSRDGVGAQAAFALPSGMAIDKNDTIYLADYTNHTVRKIVLR